MGLCTKYVVLWERGVVQQISKKMSHTLCTAPNQYTDCILQFSDYTGV